MRLNKAVVIDAGCRFAKVRKGIRLCFTTAAILALSSCAEMNPKNVDIELEKSAPEVKITNYTQSLHDLGLMSEIYDTGLMKVQSQDIIDETGTSATTGGEIQRNITEIMKSTLNSIGGNIRFIEYNPSYIQNQMVSGYSGFENKAIPDVVITGGITEFDRGLETRGDGTNLDVEADFGGAPKWFPSETAGVSYGDTSKTGKARITLDFNLKDFHTLAGIPRMSTTNSMEVYKGLREEEVGITLFGPTFGLKGQIKKVQGRHEAVRLLVQVSMVQMIGKYLALPYWRLLGDDSTPDTSVLDSIADTYYRMGREDRVGAAQQWLTLHGYDVIVNNRMDSKTMAALQAFDPALAADPNGISQELFTKLYLTIPVTREALGKRKKLNDYFVKMQQAAEQEAQKAARSERKQAKAAPAVAQQQAEPVQAVAEQVQQVAQVQAPPPPAQQQAAAPVATAAAAPTPAAVSPPATAAQAAAAKPKKFGRQLTADDW